MQIISFDVKISNWICLQQNKTKDNSTQSKRGRDNTSLFFQYIFIYSFIYYLDPYFVKNFVKGFFICDPSKTATFPRLKSI